MKKKRIIKKKYQFSQRKKFKYEKNLLKNYFKKKVNKLPFSIFLNHFYFKK